MGHARGVICLAATQAGIPLRSYACDAGQTAVNRQRPAPKSQVQQAICHEFSLAAPPEPPDVADAMAIALCHHYLQRGCSGARSKAAATTLRDCAGKQSDRLLRPRCRTPLGIRHAARRRLSASRRCCRGRRHRDGKCRVQARRIELAIAFDSSESTSKRLATCRQGTWQAPQFRSTKTARPRLTAPSSRAPRACPPAGALPAFADKRRARLYPHSRAGLPAAWSFPLNCGSAPRGSRSGHSKPAAACL